MDKEGSLKISKQMKLTSEYNNYLIQIAMKLPLLKEQSCEKHLTKGQEILDWGTVTEIDGEPIDPEKNYLYSFPVVVHVDHLKRLQKGWKRKGPDGVSEYLVWVDNLIGKQKKIQEEAAKPQEPKLSWLNKLVVRIKKAFKI
jgi:hypothetical protein